MGPITTDLSEVMGTSEGRTERQTVEDGVRLDDGTGGVAVTGRVAARRSLRREQEVALSFVLGDIRRRVNRVPRHVYTTHRLLAHRQL